MQAGDKLDFIKPFDGFSPSAELSEKERQAQTAAFAEIMRTLVFSRPELVHSFEIFEESGFVTVFEASYRLDMMDGSYLHILPFGHQQDNKLLDAGLAISEHLSDGIYNGGYVYSYNVDGVRRTRANPDAEDADMDDEDRRLHFSLTDLYGHEDELERIEQSESIDARLIAIEAREAIDTDVQFGHAMAEMGFDDQPPYEGELERLVHLIKDAYHFPLDVHAA